MNYAFKSGRGINKEIVEQISAHKNEPDWMLQFRLRALEIFERMPMPAWGGDLSGLDARNLHFYIKPIEHKHTSWDQVP